MKKVKIVKKKIWWCIGLILLVWYGMCILAKAYSPQLRYPSTDAITCRACGYGQSSTSGEQYCVLNKQHYYTANGHCYLYLDCEIDCGTECVDASKTYVVEAAIQIDGIWKEIGVIYLDGGKYCDFNFTLYPKSLEEGDYTIKVSLFRTDNVKDRAVLAEDQGTLTVADSITHTVYFDYCGGSGDTTSKVVSWGEIYNTLPTATWDGYTFLGWYTEKSGGEKVILTNTVMIWGDHTLYAHWQGNSYTLSFNANGGSTSTASKSVTYGSAYGTLPTLERTGYRFDGWYTSSSGGTEVTSTTTVSTAGNHTLYAHWTKLLTQTITATSSYTKTYKSKGKFTLDAAAVGKLTYKSSDKSVVTVSSAGVVTIKGYGTATITVKAAATGNYVSATKKITVKIKPKKMKITGISSSASKTLTVQWSKDSLATGYQVQVSTTKKFTSSKTVTDSADKNTYTKVTKKQLVSGKKYYVRIRAYVTVNGKNIYGAWSAIKSVTVK